MISGLISGGIDDVVIEAASSMKKILQFFNFFNFPTSATASKPRAAQLH